MSRGHNVTVPAASVAIETFLVPTRACFLWIFVTDAFAILTTFLRFEFRFWRHWALLSSYCAIQVETDRAARQTIDRTFLDLFHSFDIYLYGILVLGKWGLLRVLWAPFSNVLRFYHRLWLGFNLVPQRGDYVAVHLLLWVRLHPVHPTDKSGCWLGTVGGSGPLSRPAEVNWSPLRQCPAMQSCRAIVAAHIFGKRSFRIYIVLLLQKFVKYRSVTENIHCVLFERFSAPHFCPHFLHQRFRHLKIFVFQSIYLCNSLLF